MKIKRFYDLLFNKDNDYFENNDRNLCLDRDKAVAAVDFDRMNLI